jgi:hypothetical protein
MPSLGQLMNLSQANNLLHLFDRLALHTLALASFLMDLPQRKW